MAPAMDIQLVSAASILGLKPTGVEKLADSLLAGGLADKLRSSLPVVYVNTRNDRYDDNRDPETNCLNTTAILEFSLDLHKVVAEVLALHRFPLILGGDCSILLGIMPALKAMGNFGLIFFDAHADFYAPTESITGEVADMDLAMVTGRGPHLLTNIKGLQPYVHEEHVVHIGQRDREETIKYGSKDIKDTQIKCFSLADIRCKCIDDIHAEVLEHISGLNVKGFWIHFDTDVLSDDINPAVDYRLPGGLSFEEAKRLIQALLLTGKVIGLSVTIFNPQLDPGGSISLNIANCLAEAFQSNLRQQLQ